MDSSSLFAHANSTSTTTDGSHTSSNFVFFPVVFVVLLAIFFYCNFFQKLRDNQTQPTPPEQPRPRRREGAADTDAKEEKNRRREFVKSNLLFRTVKVGNEGSISSGARRSSRNILTPSNSHRSHGSGGGVWDDDKSTTTTSFKVARKRANFMSQGSVSRIPICSICLSGYYKGDEVSWSTNPTCPHEYHQDCIHDWLLSHEDCPLCQKVFLVTDAMMCKEVTAAPSTTSTTSTSPSFSAQPSLVSPSITIPQGGPQENHHTQPDEADTPVFQHTEP